MGIVIFILIMLISRDFATTSNEVIKILKLLNGDCLELIESIDDKSIDMIFTDLPYGTTACKWDSIIPLDKMWEQYERVIKDNGAIVLTASQPFTTKLINSNMKLFRYEWIWQKEKGTNFLQANRMPLKIHENICVFYKKLPKYNPQFTKGKPYKSSGSGTSGEVTGNLKKISATYDGRRYPISIQKFKSDRGYHPTQKPVELVKYMIKTYTDEGDVVLDSCMGSGTTGVACRELNRNFIGIELDTVYFNISRWRIMQIDKVIV